MKYWQAKKLSSTEFKRLTGVKKKLLEEWFILSKLKKKRKRKQDANPN
jgi:hypothetical protein